MKRILIIAGNDCSSGAGVQRDCHVAFDYGLQVQTVITAVTAQGRRGVSKLHKVPADVISAQLDAAFEDGPPDMIKIGMLGWQSTVNQVALTLAQHQIPVVLDPVIQASSGRRLLTKPGMVALLRHLLPLTRLVTPNMEEAALLTGVSRNGLDEAISRQAECLLNNGAGAILVKGGHGTGKTCYDYLFDGIQCHCFAVPRLPLVCRGTGCTLSTAIACELALEKPLSDACQRGKNYTSDWISRNGRAPP